METPQKTPEIRDWHAHVYFDPATRDAAWALRERIEKQFDIQMGRCAEKPAGPHRMFSCQVPVRIGEFAWVVSWPTLNRGHLSVSTPPNPGQDHGDHRDKGRSAAVGSTRLS